MTSSPSSDGPPDLLVSDFNVTVDGERVPCTIARPRDATPRALVLAGHGFTTSRRALYPADVARVFASRFRFAFVAVDVPAHGDRQPDGGRDRARVDREWRQHWRRHAARRITLEYSALIDHLREAGEYEGEAIGYWGLSLATQYGLGVLAGEPRIRAAVLGLSALPDPGPRIAAYAERVRCPVFFILQEHDTTATPDRARALFDRIGSAEKLLRASPGAHTDVPSAVFEEAYAFLASRLTSHLAE